MKPLALASLGIVGVLTSVVPAAPPQAWQVYEGWPFDAPEAARRQTETAKALNQPVDLKIPLTGQEGPTLDWRLIPAGRFMRGSPPTEPGHEGDETLRRETIADPSI